MDSEIRFYILDVILFFFWRLGATINEAPESEYNSEFDLGRIGTDRVCVDYLENG
jgi:hypothetical protein